MLLVQPMKQTTVSARAFQSFHWLNSAMIAMASNNTMSYLITTTATTILIIIIIIIITKIITITSNLANKKEQSLSY